MADRVALLRWLADGLAELEALQEVRSRLALRKELRKQIPLDVPVDGPARLVAFEFADACLRHPGGLRVLADVVEWFEAGTEPANRVREAIATLLPSDFFGTVAERDRYVQMLGALVEPAELAQCYEQAAGTPADRPLADIDDLVRALEVLPPHDGPEPLLVLTEIARRRETAPGLPAAVHRAIVCVDVEGFGDRRRTNPDQIAVRDGFYGALRAAFRRSGVSWWDCYWEDRGDGALILVPPRVPKHLLVTGVPRELAAALAKHNRTHDRPAQVRLRLALHAGEIHHDQHGVAGTAINVAFRLLQAEPLKQALADSAGTLAVIVSPYLYEEVIRHTPSSNPASYRQVQITVKETETLAWICRPDDPYPAGRDTVLPPAPRSLPGGEPRSKH